MTNNREENIFLIQNLHEIIERNMKSEKSKILSTNYSILHNTVTDYGPSKDSLLRIDILLTNTNTGEDWKMSLIAKTLPTEKVENKLAQQKFKNEVGLYMSAKPAIDRFLLEKGIRNGSTSFFSTALGGRLNLSGDGIVDHNAVLILQNYQDQVFGFKTLNRRTGLDMENTKAILVAMARFHGSYLGFKMQKPKEFKEKVRPYLAESYIKESVEKIARKQMIQVLKENGFSPEVVTNAVATFDRKSVKRAKEPWATFIHNNLWVKNIIIAHNDRTAKPQYVKFLNLSRSEYNSPLRDFLFFIMTSVELSVLKAYLDDIIDFYYYSLVSALKDVDLEETELSCRLAFNKELKRAASNSEFYKVLCTLYSIYSVRSFDIDCNSDMKIYIQNELQEPAHKQRLCYIVKEFNNRGWLYS